MKKPVVNGLEEMADIVRKVDDYKKATKERGEKMSLEKIVPLVAPGKNSQNYHFYKRRLKELSTPQVDQTEDEKNQIQLFDAKETLAELKPEKEKRRRRTTPVIATLEHQEQKKDNKVELVKAFMEQSAAQQKIIALLSEQHH